MFFVCLFFEIGIDKHDGEIGTQPRDGSCWASETGTGNQNQARGSASHPVGSWGEGCGSQTIAVRGWGSKVRQASEFLSLK